MLTELDYLRKLPGYALMHFILKDGLKYDMTIPCKFTVRDVICNANLRGGGTFLIE